MTVLDVLKGVYRLFDDKRRWTRQTAARNMYGQSLGNNALSEHARSWCALGGLYKVAGGDTDEFVQARKVLAEAIQPGHGLSRSAEWQIIAAHNDCRGYEAIRSALLEAIEKLSDETPVPDEPLVREESRERELVAV